VDETKDKDADDERYRLIRNYTLLAVGVGLVVYGIVPPIDPAIFTFGGAMLGVTPVARATA
jgi:hypothetical protein